MTPRRVASRSTTARPATGRATGPAAAELAPGGVLVWDGDIVWLAQAGPVPAGMTPSPGTAGEALDAWRGWQGVDLRLSDLPADWSAGGLAALVERNAAGAARRGETRRTLMLDGPALTGLGLPAPQGDTAPPPAGFGTHPALGQLREAGWRAWTSGGWINAERGKGRDRCTVTVGLMPWLLRERRYPLLAPREASVTALGLWHWERLTGTAWSTTPGGVATQVVRDTHPWSPVAAGPWWGHAAGEPAGPGDGPGDAIEHPLLVSEWSRPAPAGTIVRAYDARRAYLAAWTTVRVAVGGLRPVGPVPFDRTKAGWWLADLAPWTDPRMPDPAARWDEPAGPDGTRRVWVTTPTLELLTQLTEQGAYGGFEIRDAYLGVESKDSRGRPRPAAGKALAPAATILDRAWQVATAEHAANAAGQSEPAGRIAAAVKRAYTAAYSQWQTEHAQIKRPDWAAATIAQQRVTLWRKAWLVGQHEGRWPLAIATDCLHYAHPGDRPDDDPPWPGDGRTRGVRLGPRLGEFAVKDQDVPGKEWNTAHGHR